MEKDAEGRDEKAAYDVAYNLRHVGRRDEEHEEPEQDAADKRSGAVEQSAAEDDAESRTAQGGGKHLFPDGVGTHRTNFFQPDTRFSEGMFPGNDITR